jgi:hypothetical protein
MPLPDSHKHALKLAAALMLAAAFSQAPTALGADLTPATEQAFQLYIARTEARMEQDYRPDRFLGFTKDPEEKKKVRNGERPIRSRQSSDEGREVKITGGLIHDWCGSIFLPNTTIKQVRLVLQSYPDYQTMFAPEITASKILNRDGDRFTVFLRLYKKQIITVVLNTTYDIRYRSLDAHHLAVESRSTRIAEVKNGGKSSDEEPVGHDGGYLWRLNSYWRFEEADGGVYAELEAISLSRDVPFGLVMIRKFVEKFPRESMENTLEGVRRAVLRPAR